MAVDVSGHTAEGGVLPGDEILLPPRRHPPDQLQRRQHQVLAQLLEARLPLRCIPVHQAEELLQVRKLLRLVKQGAAVRGKQAVWRQVRQRQVPDGHAQGLIRLVCLGEFVVEGAAAAQHHISGCHLVPAEIDGVPAAALQDQQHLRQAFVAVHQCGVLSLRPVIVADVRRIGPVLRQVRRLLRCEHHPLPIQFRLSHAAVSSPLESAEHPAIRRSPPRGRRKVRSRPL